MNSSEIAAASDDWNPNGKLSSDGNGRTDSKIFYEDSELDESTANGNALNSDGLLSADAKIQLSQFSGKRGNAHQQKFLGENGRSIEYKNAY